MTIRRAAMVVSVSLAVTAQAQAPGAPGGDFADAPEKAWVAEACTACHVSAQVTGQRRSKEEWVNTVDKMIGFGAKVPDDRYDAIVGYLARLYGEEPKRTASP